MKAFKHRTFSPCLKVQTTMGALLFGFNIW